VFGLAGPAVAEPAAPKPSLEEDCAAAVDGIVVCKIVDRSDPENTRIGALARSEGGTLVGALVVLEECDGETCNPVQVATGQDDPEVRTNLQPWGRGVGYYRANASWVNLIPWIPRKYTHTGVVHPDY
jgi:hypothetical protein